MDLLARREHGRQELERKLGRRFDPGELQAALSALAREGLQSDARFAEGFARERVLRGYGPRRIQQELLQRGVSGSVADRALRDLETGEHLDWRRLARQALEKKFGESALPADFAERARRLRFLQYRGFSTEELAADDV